MNQEDDSIRFRGIELNILFTKMPTVGEHMTDDITVDTVFQETEGTLLEPGQQVACKPSEDVTI